MMFVSVTLKNHIRSVIDNLMQQVLSHYDNTQRPWGPLQFKGAVSGISGKWPLESLSGAFSRLFGERDPGSRGCGRCLLS